MWLGAIAIRVIAAIGLLVYPRISDSELTGWDAERFQEIADLPGKPWVDEPVEYPPGSVLIAEIVTADDPVHTNDRLVVLSLAIDLGIAALLSRLWRPNAGLAYLLLGLPLVPAGLLRLDLWATGAAVVGIYELRRGRNLRFAVWTVVGALIKVWPVLAIGAAIGVRKTRSAVSAVALGAVSGLLWVAYAGIDGPRQVLSLRDSTGWQLETIGGSLTGLFSDAEVTLQNDAYRIGTLSPMLVLAGRLVAIAAIAAVVWLAWRHTGGRTADDGTAEQVMLAATAAMIVTAPLLSPQFLLWLTPWAAILWPSKAAKAIALAIIITGFVGPAFGYANLADPVPAVLLLARDAALIGAILLVMVELWSSRPPTSTSNSAPQA